MSDLTDLQFNQNEFNYLEVLKNPFKDNKILFIQMEKVAQDKQNPLVGAFYELAIHFFNKKQYKKSADYFEKAMEIDTDYQLGYADHIYALYKQGKLLEAAKWADILNDVPSNNFWAVQYYKSMVASARKRYGYALKDIHNAMLYCNDSEKTEKFLLPKKRQLEKIIAYEKKRWFAVAFILFEVIFMSILTAYDQNLGTITLLIVTFTVFVVTNIILKKNKKI